MKLEMRAGMGSAKQDFEKHGGDHSVSLRDLPVRVQSEGCVLSCCTAAAFILRHSPESSQASQASQASRRSWATGTSVVEPSPHIAKSDSQIHDLNSLGIKARYFPSRDAL